MVQFSCKMINLMNSETDEMTKQQTEQIFNIAEKPIMEYISMFLDEHPNIVFKDNMPEISLPVILLPFDNYKKDIYVKFTLKPIHLEESCKNEIDKVIHHERIKETIGFLYYCIKIAYSSIVASCMINSQPLVNTKLELDENNWVFRPKFLHELSHKKLFLEESLAKLMDMKTNTSDYDINAINKETANMITELVGTQRQITNEIIELEEKINNSYSNKVVLGIMIEEIHKDDMPNPDLNTDMPKLESSNKELTNSESHQLPNISNTKYTDSYD